MQQIAIYLLWVLWAISWVAAAGWSSATKRRAPFREELISRGFTGAGVLLLFGIYSPRYISVISLWHVGELTGWLLVLLAIAGFALTWWARIHMRTLWSGTITVKNEHHVVNTGPYRYVRHPIYTGLIIASFAPSTILSIASKLPFHRGDNK